VKEHRSGDFAYIHLVYGRLFANLADEAETFDAQVVELLNEKVTDKAYNICFGESPTSIDYTNGGGRCHIDIASNGVNITWNPESSVCSSPMYPYSDKYGIVSYLMNQESDSGVSLAVTNLLKDKKALGDAAIEKVKTKLGPEWTIECDFAGCIKAIKQYRSGDVPYLHLVYERLYRDIAADVLTLDADEVEALNEKVGDKKRIHINWASNPKDVDYYGNGGGRCILAFSEGLHILWNPETTICSDPVFPYSDKYGIKKFVLDNC